MTSSFAHPREARILQRGDFTRAHSSGTRAHARQLTLIVLDNTTARARLGCAVSRRVGNAVVRNRIRRLLKELFRHHAHRWPPVDLVVIAKPELAELAAERYATFERVLLPIIERAVLRGRRPR